MSSGFDHDQDRLDMARLAAGHDAALNDLIGRHAARLLQFLVRELQNEAEAADLAEETMVRIYQHCRRFDPKQKFSTWLYAIAVNLVRDKLRWRARHPEVSIEAQQPGTKEGLLAAWPDARPVPSEDLERTERAEAVRRAVSELPEDLKTPLVLAEYEGLSHIEIAEILDCSAKAVEMRIYRARQQLRERLAGLLMEG